MLQAKDYKYVHGFLILLFPYVVGFASSPVNYFTAVLKIVIAHNKFHILISSSNLTDSRYSDHFLISILGSLSLLQMQGRIFNILACVSFKCSMLLSWFYFAQKNSSMQHLLNT